MELKENERQLVNLINQLSEFANDETTTQEAIDGIIGEIKRKANESVKAEIDDADNFNPPTPEFPVGNISGEINNAIESERLKMLEDIKSTHDDVMNQPKGPDGQMFFTRIREVKAPGKAHPYDAGIDFYIPNEKAWDDDFKKKVIDYSKNKNEDDVYFVEDDEGIGMYVKPNAHVAIPSGIKTIIPQGLGMMFVNKSGVATKMKLDHSACLVDSEYRDEIIMCFFNHNTDSVLLRPGMKITQGLIVPIINMDIQEVLNCVYDDMGKETDRGGGFGSSGTN